MFNGIEYSSVEPTVNMFFLLSIFPFFSLVSVLLRLWINLRYVAPQRWLPIFHNMQAFKVFYAPLQTLIGKKYCLS